MKAIIGGLVTGFAAYYLIKWVRDKSALTAGIGDEAGVYANLFGIRGQLQNATELYMNASKKIEDLDMQLTSANCEYAEADAERKLAVMFRIAEIQRQRDQAVLEAELVIRNVITPLREKLITEEARLKSAVIGPDIALNRAGSIPSF
jgi:glycine/D-amino acid oxidase-like deaminating enzyme